MKKTNQKQSAIELELAWLVQSLPADLKKHRSVVIRQAYLASDDPKVKDIRIREKGGKYTQTTKTFLKNAQETGFNREETIEIEKKEFDEFFRQSKKRVKKIRYFYPLADNLIAEVDLYQDNLKGLDVVEVEFPNFLAYENFTPPAWFGKEVTDSKGVYPPLIANLTIKEVNEINQKYRQKPHDFG
ncbi:adenylate cyclase [Patescibacteria group bacterium]